jgi:hypothetical protein
MSITDLECVFVAKFIHAYANEEDFVRIFEIYLAVSVTDMYSKMCLYLLDLLTVYFLLLFPLCRELRNFYVFSWAAGG